MIEVINNNCSQKTKDIIAYKEKHGIKFGSEKADHKPETKDAAATSGVLVS